MNLIVETHTDSLDDRSMLCGKIFTEVISPAIADAHIGSLSVVPGDGSTIRVDANPIDADKIPGIMDAIRHLGYVVTLCE